MSRSCTVCVFFFFSSRRRHTRFDCDWSSDVCSSDLDAPDQCGSEGAGAVYVFGEGFAFGPLQSEVVEAVRFAVVVRADDARVLDPRAVPGLPQEALHGRGVASETWPQYLDRP